MKNFLLKNAKKTTLLASLLILVVASVFVVPPPQQANSQVYAQSFNEVRSVDSELGKEYTRVITRGGETFERDIRFDRTFSIDEDFCDETIIVTLRSAYSIPNNSFSADDFSVNSRQRSSVMFADVEDLTYFTDSRMKNKFLNSATATERNFSAEERHFSSFNQILSLRLVDSGKDNVLASIEELETLDKVLAAEPSFNWVPVTNATGHWGLDRINVTDAWSIAGNGAGIRVGVMEGGVLPHTSLGNRLLQGNIAPNPNDAHGISVAGIIAGSISGVARGASIVPLSWNDLVGSLTFARNNNVSIVNASFRFTQTVNGVRYSAGPSTAHANAIAAFPGLFVGAAGNANWNNDVQNFQVGWVDSGAQFPASYRLPNVISVGASDQQDRRIIPANFGWGSNFGATTVDIFAPGTNIRTTAFNNAYTNVFNGTSSSAPHVAGVAALMISGNPELLYRPDEIRNILMNTVDTNANLQNISVSGGRLNAYRAVVSSMFHFPGYTTVKVPHGITTIPAETFRNNTTIEHLIVPSSVREIGAYAFIGATSLKSITLLNRLTTFHDTATAGLARSQITLYVPNDHTGVIQPRQSWAGFRQITQGEFAGASVPHFTSNYSEHGTITASGYYEGGREPFGAFDGWVGTVAAGTSAGFNASQWTKLDTSGWIELRLNYAVYIHQIQFINRSGSGRTRDAYFTGANGVPLGGMFRGNNLNRSSTFINVPNVRTHIIRLNVLNSWGDAIGANEIRIFTNDPSVQRWVQPTWTSATNEHGTITGAANTAGRHPFGAFDGWVGDVGPGNAAGFAAVQWTRNSRTGWLQLELNYYITVHRIVFYNRFSSGSHRTRDAYFSGSNGIRLGTAFVGVNASAGRSVITVDGVRTRIIRLNITSSWGTHVGANQIIIHATV
ncbi:MAG: S8 family serine peptidase [Firmicutes bacterium]|nr:S8 family serine peptidase [Bacillota bacterium]